MVVNAQGQAVFSVVQGNLLVVLHILYDEHVLSTDAFVQLALELSVRKVGESCVDLELRGTVFVHHSTDAKVARVQIIVEIYLLDKSILLKIVTLRDDIVFE